jgi:hypothetical protein
VTRVAEQARGHVEHLGRLDLPPKKPPAPSVRRGRSATSGEDELYTRARAAAERGCDLVRCMGCGRLAELPISQRGRRLRCTRCGAVGLNVSAIEPDPGQPERSARRNRAG